ncbi:MAG TPA: septal ring lytic transglycosylase RlpA family protein [Baekduia sp.]|nr:septal ring lytic transglycosylase RlpA family protein [Baekduia sp.]
MPNTISVKLGAALAALALTIPATAVAADPFPGGLSFDDPTAPTVFPDGSTLTSPVDEMLGDPVEFAGSLAGAHRGDQVAIQRLAAHGWRTAATTTAGSGGTFSARWRPRRPGHVSVRVVPATAAATVRAADALPVRAVSVYQPVRVTWYGPGFYGHRTACGQRLTRQLLGVADRRLPCGTPVELYKDGRTITVPVVDRGPFRRHVRYDLTAATAQALGVTATTDVGTIAPRVRRRAR